MAKVLYTAHAHVTGGRDGHGATTDGKLDPVSTATTGTDPTQPLSIAASH